jgi:hypothetical protein
MKRIDRDPACFTVLQDDSSRKVTGNDAECTGSSTVPETTARSQGPVTSDEALRLAVKLAVDEGDLDRVAALVEVLRSWMAKSTAIIGHRGHVPQ